MAILRDSGKFSTEETQIIIFSGSTVLFRAIEEEDGFKFMTATAQEDSCDLQPFADQESLNQKSRSFFLEIDRAYTGKCDLKGRPYVEAFSF